MRDMKIMKVQQVSGDKGRQTRSNNQKLLLSVNIGDME